MHRGFLLSLLAAGLIQAQEKPVELYRGMGSHHHPIATQNAEAQKFFDQGLLLYYGFNRYEAQRSFRRAAELDPQAIMPRWGVAITYAPHINMDLDGDADLKKGCQEATAAAKLQGPKNEQAYAKAAAAMCQGEDAYRLALRDLHRAYPDDPDAASLYAEALMVPVRWRWWKNGMPNGEMGACIAVLESVMKRDPDHPGANHFYVHAMEMSPHPEYALPSAQRLMGGIAPGAGHMVHMAGHIYIRVGDYEVVASSNERAVQVDEEYFHHSGVHGGYMGYYAHNLHFLVAARMLQGRFEDAHNAALKLSEVTKPFVEMAPGMIDPFIPTPWFVLLRFQKWDDILNAKPVDNEKLPVTQVIWHYSRAMAFHGKGRREEADKERRAFEAQRLAVPASAMWINNKAVDILSLASEILAARMAGSDKDAIVHWRKAVALQDAQVYDEPPPWYYPVRESLGGALLRSGDAKQAEAVFRADLDRNPRNGRSLFGLWKSLEAQGRDVDAMWVKAEFERAWKRAQVTLRIEDY
jgi:tetratricopeptide (TPR) repeat protein